MIEHPFTDETDPLAILRATETADDEATLRRLRGTLAEAAQRAGLLDISYRTIDSPVGSLLLAATEEGLLRVAFDREGHDRILGLLADRVSARILSAPARLDPVATQLDEYFAGHRKAFQITLDLRLSTGFRRQVLSRLTEIGYGHTASYAAVAQSAGNPKAVRAVGSACATNPLPVIVPCHRVVRSDGTIGNYLGGHDAKVALLAMESGTSAA